MAADGVYVGTRYKRVQCKGLAASSALKTLKDVEALAGSLQPDSPLRSVSFAGNHRKFAKTKRKRNKLDRLAD